MTEATEKFNEVRDEILANPKAFLEDHDIMRALIAADRAQQASNVIDLRSIAMDRMEDRLNKLEDTHRTVIAAAYDNVSSTNQIHRAVLSVLEPEDFTGFLKFIENDLANTLGIDAVCLCLETQAVSAGQGPSLSKEFGTGVTFMAIGEIEDYITHGRNMNSRPVTMRATKPQQISLFPETADPIRSEALLKLDLGKGNLPGMLVLGSSKVDQFAPAQGSDLLLFLGGIFARIMRRWLA
ncbi:DUF484 family protein [Amylibacter sp. SFDW26]|uniref:DUF484 family protein n=1 Tax=Amylibacter sp. SFDW26 TaxID=2652722 RepID=UPI00126293C1|nr:DUF484 family protein [Amylibacter sp. SFDW26]KAB7610475.1 DUF484 family protein [Amylibacter sp. SFDW26]